jgi:hypothetical protein
MQNQRTEDFAELDALLIAERTNCQQALGYSKFRVLRDMHAEGKCS